MITGPGVSNHISPQHRSVAPDLLFSTTLSLSLRVCDPPHPHPCVLFCPPTTRPSQPPQPRALIGQSFRAPGSDWPLTVHLYSPLWCGMQYLASRWMQSEHHHNKLHLNITDASSSGELLLECWRTPHSARAICKGYKVDTPPRKSDR